MYIYTYIHTLFPFIRFTVLEISIVLDFQKYVSNYTS